MRGLAALGPLLPAVDLLRHGRAHNAAVVRCRTLVFAMVGIVRPSSTIRTAAVRAEVGMMAGAEFQGNRGK
jgi:hypothetical protein